MGIFNDYMREGKGVGKDANNRPRIIIFFDIFFRKFWKLITINLMYIIFCLPIITIGPATAGITKILRNYAREEHAFIFADFWDTFKQNFKKAFIIGILDILIVGIVFFDIYVYLQIITDKIVWIITLAVLMLTTTIFLFMNYYIYTLLITFKLSFKQVIKNSFLFAWIGFWRNLGITIILAALSAFVVLYFNTLGTIFVILLYFSLSGLIINFITYPLIKKHMIDGYDPKTGEKLED